MKEEWLFPGAMVPVDVETTAALVAEIKRLIDVVGGMALAQPEQEPRPLEQDYTSLVAYTRALEEYCDALAQPEQEPDVVMHCESHTWTIKNPPAKGSIDVNLYYAPAQRTWVGLTDKERSKIWRDVVKWGDPSHDDVDLMKALEAYLKDKNT